MKKIIFFTAAVAILLPVLILIIWSFAHQWFYPGVLPESWSMRSWGYLWNVSGSQIRSSLVESVILSSFVAFVSVAVALPAGRALGLYEFQGKSLLAFILMLPVVVPPLTVAMGLHLWFIQLDLADTLTGVVLIHLTFSLPYSIFVLWGVFANYNPDIEQQAQTLGAGKFQLLVYVTLPVVKSGIIIAGLFSFLVSWSQYLSTLIIGGGEVITLPVLLFALMGSGDRPVAAAVSLVFLVPALAALLFSSKSMKQENLPGVW